MVGDLEARLEKSGETIIRCLAADPSPGRCLRGAGVAGQGGWWAHVDAVLDIPVAGYRKWTEAQILREVENNAQDILGYVVRWIEQGIGCSKVPDINDVGLMDHRAPAGSRPACRQLDASRRGRRDPGGPISTASPFARPATW